jgi:hypothetical protein
LTAFWIKLDKNSIIFGFNFSSEAGHFQLISSQNFGIL